MAKVQQVEKNTEERIFEELTFIGEHIIYLEKILQQMLLSRGGQPGMPPNPLRRRYRM
mgnify:CR=1 FL=1